MKLLVAAVACANSNAASFMLGRVEGRQLVSLDMPSKRLCRRAAAMPSFGALNRQEPL
jgi:hypothetical protein